MATSAGNLKSATQVLGRIAGYELLEQVGRGGMGVVFRARDPNLDKIVAIKILPDERARDAEYRARFLREARTEASIDHPLIACCFSIGEADLDPPDLIPSATQEPPLPRKLYLTMEFIPGSDLSALVHGEPLAIERVLDLAGQIAEGLEVAHAAGVVHRDIKPANVRVTPDGRVKLLDFGLAAIIPKPNSKTDSFKSSIDRKMGTCHFMSPEQTNGRTIDPRTDLFSLGVVLYLLVTGRLPFTGETPYEVEDAITAYGAATHGPLCERRAAELERITQKLLAKDASNRYQSAHEVHTDLVLLGKGPIAPEPESFGHRALLIAFGAVLVLIAAWAIWRDLCPAALACAGRGAVREPNRRPAARLSRRRHRGEPDRLPVPRLAAERCGRIDRAEDRALGSEPPGTSSTSWAWTAMLAGSLSKRDELLHLDLELVEGGHGFVIWAASYDYDLAASDDVERQIVRDLTRKVSGPSGGQAPPRPTKPTPARRTTGCSVRGRRSTIRTTRGPIGRWPTWRRRWNRIPTSRSLGHAAVVCCGRSGFGTGRRSLRGSRRRPRIARVRLDPELLEARLARAQVYRGTGRYAAAIRELSEVLKINPNWDEAELQLAGRLPRRRRPRECRVPLSPHHRGAPEVLAQLELAR
jgi:hypothetical protein